MSWLQDGYDYKQVFEYPDTYQNEDYDIVYDNHAKAVRKAITRAAALVTKEKK